MVDAIGGRDQNAMIMFITLGISFSDQTRRARNVLDVFQQIARSVRRISDPSLQARVSAAFFGPYSEDILPLLCCANETVDEYLSAAEK
jgi:hypothetical protein